MNEKGPKRTGSSSQWSAKSPSMLAVGEGSGASRRARSWDENDAYTTEEQAGKHRPHFLGGRMYESRTRKGRGAQYRAPAAYFDSRSRRAWRTESVFFLFPKVCLARDNQTVSVRLVADIRFDLVKKCSLDNPKTISGFGQCSRCELPPMTYEPTKATNAPQG